MSSKLIVSGAEITVTTIDDRDYISLTDMLKAKDGDFLDTPQKHKKIEPPEAN